MKLWATPRKGFALFCAVTLFAAPSGAATPQRGGAEATRSITLPEAVFLGLRNNRDIRSEYLQRIADKFALKVAEDVFTPRVYLGGTALQSRTSGTVSNTGSLTPTVTLATPTGASFTFGWANQQINTRGSPNTASSQLTMQFIQPLLAGGGVDFATSSLRLARIAETGNKLKLKQTLISSISNIVLAYRASIQARQQLRIGQDALRRARDLLDVNRALLAAGRIAQVELVQSEASIAQQELQLSTAQNADEAARLALLTLLALPPTSRLVAVDTLIATPVTVDRAHALQVAHDTQPAYLTQRLSIESGQINLEVARNQRLWSVNLVGSSGQNGAGANIYQAIPNLPSTKTDYSIGLQVSIPLYDPTREQGEVNAGVALRQAELQTAQADDALQQQVTDAVRNIDTARRQLDLAKRARELAESQEQIELLKLQVGRSSNFQVVSLQNDLQAAQSTELQSVITYQNALTQLDQVVGTTLDTWKIRLNDS
jgi:outer membrane protein TolC